MRAILEYGKMPFPTCRAVIFSIFFCCMAFSAPAFAVTDKADITVGMKTLPLLTTKITGTVTLAIVFDPANAESKTEAQEIKAVLDGNFQASGDIKLVGLLLPVQELGNISHHKIAIITGGLSKYYDAIGAATANTGILTMSTDLDCVRANKCILGIVSKPTVDIYYSRSAADSAKTGFSQAFTMLVKQI